MSAVRIHLQYIINPKKTHIYDVIEVPYMNNKSVKHLPVKAAGVLLLILLIGILCTGCVSAESADAVVSTTAVPTPVPTQEVTVVTVNPIADFFTSLGEKFSQNFLEKGRYNYIIQGLQNTLLIAVFALLIGLVLGTLIAVVRTVHDHHGKLNILNAICKVYLTIIRGTPVLVQLLIIYYVIFATVDMSKILVGSIAFGINSAAYVAEIIRAGINAVPKGQFEAGYSLGLPFKFTMILIILPQAIKNILPALCNEGITLLKETSVSGYIGVMDLTKAGDVIRSQTFEAFMPLIGVAVIYLAMVMILTALVNKLEKRLNKGNGVSA